jgi:hypothetical protein
VARRSFKERRCVSFPSFPFSRLFRKCKCDIPQGHAFHTSFWQFGTSLLASGSHPPMKEMSREEKEKNFS